MNQLLDSPLEALAFNYISFGIFTVVNNLWTWVAVLTAALSFWRIRASVTTSSGSVNELKPSTTVSDRAQDESRPVPRADEKSTPPSAPVSTSASAVETCVDQLFVCKGGKFKLTVNCYEEDEETSDVDVNVVDGEMKVTGWSDGGGEWWESWERLLTLRNGEKGWYRYQDLTALNGNVVRLWDDESRRCRRRM